MEAATSLSLPAFEEGAVPGAAAATSAKERKKAAAVDAVRLLPKLLDACIWGRQEDAHEVGAAIAAAIEASHPALAERITKRLGQQLRPKRFRQCPAAPWPAARASSRCRRSRRRAARWPS